MISDLEEFIRTENVRNSKSLADEIRRCNDERMSALEASLSFALTTNETLAKRLSEVEHRTQQTERDFCRCAERLVTVEEQLDQMQQRELHGWLIFSRPAIPRAPRSGRAEDSAHQLQDLIRNHMQYDMDMRQVGELQREERLIRVRFNTVAAGSDRHLLVRNKTVEIRSISTLVQPNTKRISRHGYILYFNRVTDVAATVTNGTAAVTNQQSADK